MSDLQFIPAQADDLEKISAFIRAENHESRTTAAYLRWWYFQNPARVYSLQYLQREGAVIGFASLNNMKVRVSGESKLAGMPQKVLTAEPLRGKGFFGKLYWKTEEESLAKGTDLFLTFTNAASTPIFLGKFSYRRGLCPDLVLLPAQLMRIFSRVRYRRVPEVAAAFLDQPIYSPENAIEKSAGYIRWRYMTFDQGQYDVLEVLAESGAAAGYAILKKITKKGLPFFLLMDVLAHRASELPLLVEQAALFATRRGGLALLYLDFPEISAVARNRLHRRVTNRFNFLVKGTPDAQTESLAEVPFAFSFGDFDFT